MSRQCPYLHTVNRARLDFDFEKECHVTLATTNIYACLVCGKYFQGRGRTSPAFMHSLNEDHRVYMHLDTLKIYCLPDNYEVEDSSLDDIKHAIRPEYTEEQVKNLDVSLSPVMDLSRKLYLPGYIGLNNIKANDYINVCFQALAHVPALRNFMLLLASTQEASESNTPFIVRAFSNLTKKLWNAKAFKDHVSPHELLQAIHLASNNKYFLGKQEDPQEFMNWILNCLKSSFLTTLKRKRTDPQNPIIDCFQGLVEVTSKKAQDASFVSENNMFVETYQEAPTSKVLPFLHLSLDLPPMPLFQSGEADSILPEVALESLLLKYNLSAPQDQGTQVVTYKLTSLPKYLILFVKRFKKSRFGFDKNTTVVNFPLTDLELRKTVEKDGKRHQEKRYYRLIANICHESATSVQKSEEKIMSAAVRQQGSYKVQLLNRASDQWLEIQDLVVTEIQPELLFMSESYIQIWERQSNK